MTRVEITVAYSAAENLPDLCLVAVFVLAGEGEGAPGTVQQTEPSARKKLWARNQKRPTLSLPLP